jgi:phosphoribosylpyrophosphate synthetase
VAKILKNHANYWSGWLAYFGDYKPWGVHRQSGGTWDDFPVHSKNILDFKKGKTDPIAGFVGMIEPELPENIAIAIVPGHDPAKPGKGLPTIAAELAANGHRIHASRVLVRTKKIEKLANGGNRSEDVHDQSITVKDVHLIIDKDVLLLDDVAKTGNSLRVCQKKLLAAGARSVACAAIGKT